MTNKDDPKPTTPAAPDSTAKPSSLSPWEALEPGAVVLWRVDPKEGWFECKIVAVSKDRKTLSLKWRDWPSFPQFDVKRLAVGIICKVS
jgi:hypothetical protein